MKIKVLGTGCPKCKKLYAEAEKAIAASGVAAELEKVEKIDDIMKYGVMMTPALVIDEEVKASGRIAPAAEIVSWLTTAAAKGGAMSGGRDCCCGTDVPTLIFACSGSSNVGQLTNSVALRLAREGHGTMSCLAGVGAHISGFVVPAKDCERLVVLDGCDHRCALRTFEHVGATPKVYLNLIEHGFVKRHGAPPDEAELARAHTLVTERLKEGGCSTAL